MKKSLCNKFTKTSKQSIYKNTNTNFIKTNDCKFCIHNMSSGCIKYLNDELYNNNALL